MSLFRGGDWDLKGQRCEGGEWGVLGPLQIKTKEQIERRTCSLQGRLGRHLDSPGTNLLEFRKIGITPYIKHFTH